MINRDVERYAALLRIVGSLSRLFSENDAAYVDSRFVERLFVQTTGAKDLGRKDISFDAQLDEIGIGVKTFLGGTGTSKREKVAEFTAYARDGRFQGLTPAELVKEVVKARNERVLSDAAEYGIDVSKSVYHCLIRFAGGAIVHEEPYGTIDLDAVMPTNSSGQIVGSWSEMGQGVYFTDGKSNYSFSIAKNVLMKQFVFDPAANFIPIEIIDNPLDDLETAFAGHGNGIPSNASISQIGARTTSTLVIQSAPLALDLDLDLVPCADYVILPLYAVKNGQPFVPEKSGLNQWNAAGRPRKLGETYISIPRTVHDLAPGFFPARDSVFDLQLPNQKLPVQAKVCQEGGKALMTNPNFHLGSWLIGVVRPTISQEQFESTSNSMDLITYDDLLRIEKDAVRVLRQRQGDHFLYTIEFAPVGSYEEFISLAE